MALLDIWTCQSEASTDEEKKKRRNYITNSLFCFLFRVWHDAKPSFRQYSFRWERVGHARGEVVGGRYVLAQLTMFMPFLHRICVEKAKPYCLWYENTEPKEKNPECRIMNEKSLKSYVCAFRLFLSAG